MRLRCGFAVGAIAGVDAAMVFGALMFVLACTETGTAFARWLRYSALQIVVVTIVAAVLGGILGTGTLRLSSKRSTRNDPSNFEVVG